MRRNRAVTFDRGHRPPYHAPAMTNPLLDHVLPQELAERGQVIDVKGKVGSFDRLARIVEADLAAVDEVDRPREWRDMPVEIMLEFAWIDARQTLPAVKGRVRASVMAVCQRCLEAFEMSVDTSFRIMFVGGDKAGEPTDQTGFDAWELDQDTIRPLEIVEEWLIMALPLAPMHNLSDSCGPLVENIAQGRPDTARPFADLRSQMEKLNK